MRQLQQTDGFALNNAQFFQLFGGVAFKAALLALIKNSQCAEPILQLQLDHVICTQVPWLNGRLAVVVDRNTYHEVVCGLAHHFGQYAYFLQTVLDTADIVVVFVLFEKTTDRGDGLRTVQ